MSSHQYVHHLPLLLRHTSLIGLHIGIPKKVRLFAACSPSGSPIESPDVESVALVRF